MKKTHQILAGLSFLISFIIYLMTMAPTTSFWDCGEFIATSVIMGVPHPPGTPLYLILGNVFSQLPLFDDLGARVNLLSVIASAFAVMFLYLISVQFIEEWRGNADSISDQLINYGSAFIGAMTFAVTDSHWFNAVEAEVYAMSTFFTGICVWLILSWSKHSGESGNVRYILIIAYMLGLATGIHLLNLLTLPFIALIIFFRKYDYSHKGFFMTVSLTLLSFVIIYLGIIKGIPNLANDYGLYAPIIAVLFVFISTIYSIRNDNNTWSVLLTCLVLVFIGFSSYATIFIRASQHPAINENNPDTVKGALAYMNRDQYGDWSILDRKSTLMRPENAHWNRFVKNKNNPTDAEVRSFVWNYQFKEMYFRYFLWQFAGKEDYSDRTWDITTVDGKLIKKLQGISWFRYGLPLALLFGLAGLGHHFYKDPKRALALLSLFLATGLMIIVYLNQYDPQPRERDYSFVGSFFAFSIWISIGIAGLLERTRELITNNSQFKIVSVACLSIIFIAMPFTMGYIDYHEHDRTGNYVAWDYAYNMLNSCEPNGIIFTNGDNDTFPLWYIQEVEGVRKDVRVVNLSLLNTPWYIEQLKNYEPKIPIDLKDSHISQLDPVVGTGMALSKWTEEWSLMRSQLSAYFLQEAGLTYNIREHGIPMEWKNINAKLKFHGEELSVNINPTISNYLRVQDIMVLQILDDIEDNRPVYFAVTVSPGNRVGLDKYLEMEGLVYNISTKQTDNDEMSPRLNYDKMKLNITETNESDFIIRSISDYNSQISKNKGLYRYTNLNDNEVYFNSNIQRLVQNYRSGFLQLALEDLYSTDNDGKTRSLNLLHKMDSYFPPNIIPVSEPELDIQIGRIFSQAGEPEELRKRLIEIENRKRLDLETTFYIAQVYMNDLNASEDAIRLYLELKIDYPYISDIRLALVQIYSQLEQYDNAIKELEEWLIADPNSEQAAELLKYLQSQV